MRNWKEKRNKQIRKKECTTLASGLGVVKNKEEQMRFIIKDSISYTVLHYLIREKKRKIRKIRKIKKIPTRHVQL